MVNRNTQSQLFRGERIGRALRLRTKGAWAREGGEKTRQIFQVITRRRGNGSMLCEKKNRWEKKKNLYNQVANKKTVDTYKAGKGPHLGVRIARKREEDAGEKVY